MCVTSQSWSGYWHFFHTNELKVLLASAAAVQRVQREDGALHGQSHFEPLLWENKQEDEPADRGAKRAGFIWKLRVTKNNKQQPSGVKPLLHAKSCFT